MGSQSTGALWRGFASDNYAGVHPEVLEALGAVNVGHQSAYGGDVVTDQARSLVRERFGADAEFFPVFNGTGANVVALQSVNQRWQSVICAASAHIHVDEGGAPESVAGLKLWTVPTADGKLRPDDVQGQCFDMEFVHRAQPGAVSITQSSEMGTVYSPDEVSALAEVAHANNLALHMDGARLVHASIASGISMRDFAAQCDSVWIDLSKGLGCPVGSVLAGSQDFIDDVWVWKHRLGGAMRQSGVLAAAGLYALDHHIDRLAKDHANAKFLANAIEEMPGLRLDPGPVETNLVFFDVSESGKTAPEITSKLLESGIRMGATTEKRIRAVTHLDVSKDDVQKAINALRHIIQN